jgi:hypothetical protein
MGNVCSAGDTTHPHTNAATASRHEHRGNASLTTVGPHQVMSSPTLYPSMPATHVASSAHVASPLDAADARSSPPPALSKHITGRIEASIDDNAVSARESSSGAGNAKDHHLCRVKGETFDEPNIQLGGRTPHAGGTVAATTPHAGGRQRHPSVFHSTVSRQASWENQPPTVSEAIPALPPKSALDVPHLQCVVSPPVVAVVAKRVTSSSSVRSILAATPTFSASSSCNSGGPFDDDVDASFHRKQPEDSLELPAASCGAAVVNASRQSHRPSSVVHHYAVPSSPIAQRNNLDGHPLAMAHPHAGSTDDCSSPLGSIYKFGRRRRSSSRSPSHHAVVHVARTPQGGGSCEHADIAPHDQE